MPVEIPIGAKADDASWKKVADQADKVFTELGGKIGNDLGSSIAEGLSSSESAVRSSANKVANSYDKVADSIGKTKTIQEQLNAAQASGNTVRIVRETERLEAARRQESRAIRQAVNDLRDYEEQARRSSSAFGSGFSSGFSRSRVGGYFSDLKAEAQSSGSVAGVLAGRAMGAGLTAGLAAATGGVAAAIGGIGYALTKGFQRYEAIDSAKHRLDNLNKTLASTGKAELDVKAVMDTVNDVVQGTPFSLDSAFSLSTRALSSNTGDLKRFMTVVADAAGFTGDGIDNIGDAFLQVANTGKVSMEQISNQLRNLPVLPWLQQQLGVTGAELQKMISDGKVGLNDLMRAVEANASGFAKSAGDSLEGSISNMQTAVARTGAKALGALFGQPTDDANTLKDAVTVLTGKIDQLGKWIDDHRDDIRQFFEDGVSVAESLAGAVGFVSDHIDLLGIAAGGLGAAFIGWKTIKGVTDLTDNLGKVETLLSKTLPDSAASGAAAMTRALGPVAALLAALEAADWRDRLNPNDSRNIVNQARNGQWGRVLLGDAWDWFGFGKDRPPAPAPAPAPASAPNFYKDWYPSIAGGTATGAGPAGAPILDAPGLSGDGEKDKAPPQFDPSLWSLDAIPVPGVPAGMPMGGPMSAPMQIAGGPPMSLADVIAGMPGLGLGGSRASRGFYQVDPQKVFDAETALLNARNRVEESRIRLLELEHKENVSQSALISAKHNVLEAERALQSAQMKAVEAQQGTLKKQTDAMTELGAAIDQDFGISKGLPGIAENITKFLANLAFAPALGALQAVVYAGGQGAASSAIGAGAPVSAAAGIGGYGYPMNAGGNVAAMIALAQSASGNVKYGPASDLVNGLADCSGSISDLVEMLETGRTTPGRLFTTTDFATDAGAARLGFLPGYMPGALNVGVNPYPGQSGHMAATLPNGVNFEGGGATGGGAQYGGSAAGALDRQFEKHYYMPVGPSAMPYGALGGGGGGYGYMPSAGAVIGGDGAALPGLVPGGGQGLVPATIGSGPGSLPGPASIGIAGPGNTGSAGMAPVGLAPSTGAGGEGFSGISGLPLDAMMTAASALDVIAPGASIAAQKGIQLINRAIGYGGQLAGIGVSGLLNTFLPHESPLADMGNSWFGRIASGFAGARPAGKNMAGQSTLPNPDDARMKAQQGGQPAGTTNNTTNITVEGRNQNDQQLANEVAYQNHAIQQYAPVKR